MFCRGFTAGAASAALRRVASKRRGAGRGADADAQNLLRPPRFRPDELKTTPERSGMSQEARQRATSAVT